MKEKNKFSGSEGCKISTTASEVKVIAGDMCPSEAEVEL